MSPRRPCPRRAAEVAGFFASVFPSHAYVLTPVLVLILILCGALIALAPGCSRRPPAPPRQAILVVLDAARPDRFSCYGWPRPTTPEIDRLAAEGAVFSNAYSLGTETRAALPRLLYSRYFAPEIFPNHHSIPYADPRRLFLKVDGQAVSLPRALEAQGVLTGAISAHEWLTVQTPFAREFLEFRDLRSELPFDPKYATPRADKVVDAALEWLAKNKDRDYFLYLHLMDTHFPHYFEDDAAALYGEGRYEGGAFTPMGLPKDIARELTAEDRKYFDALYGGGLRYADREIGRLAAALRKWGRLDDTLLVITSDHGEFLMERVGLFSHPGPWYEPLARVPLIVRYPRRVRPARRGEFCGQVDISPTMLGLLGVQPPEGVSFDGRALLGTAGEDDEAAPAEPTASEYAFAEHGVRGERYKLVFIPSGTPTLGREELPLAELPRLNGQVFDLALDPAESRNIVESVPDIARALASAYRAKLKGPYDRFLASTADGPPDFSFAVSCWSFGADIEVPKVEGVDKVEELLKRTSPAGGGWVGRESWDFSWFFARKGARPLRIQIPMPDGKYFLSADILGECEIEVDGYRKPLKSTAESIEVLQWDPLPAEVGEIEVRGRVFRATVVPKFATPWFVIRSLGFDPVVDGKRAGNYDEDRLKRLKSLGYLR